MVKWRLHQKIAPKAGNQHIYNQFGSLLASYEKDWLRIKVFKVDEATIIPPLIKAPKEIFGYDVSQYDRTLAFAMSFNTFEASGLVLYYQNIWSKAISQFIEKLETDSTKREDKLSMISWNCKKKILKLIFMVMKFSIWHVLQNKWSVQVRICIENNKNCYLRVHFKKCKYTNAKI